MKTSTFTPSPIPKRNNKSPHTLGRLLLLAVPFVDVLIPWLTQLSFGWLHEVHEVAFLLTIPVRLILVYLMWRSSKGAKYWLGAWSCLGIILTLWSLVLIWVMDKNELFSVAGVQFVCLLYTFWICFGSDEIRSLQHHVRIKRGL